MFGLGTNPPRNGRGTDRCNGCCPNCEGKPARGEGTGTCNACSHTGHNGGCPARRR